MADIGPAPQFPERAPNVFERKVVAATPGERGPLRFQEGIGTDTDVPNQFAVGALQGYDSAPGRPNRNVNVWEKPAEETARERAHVGSAAWVEAPDFLSEFAQGSFSDYGRVEYQEVVRSGRGQEHANPATVTD